MVSPAATVTSYGPGVGVGVAGSVVGTGEPGSVGVMRVIRSMVGAILGVKLGVAEASGVGLRGMVSGVGDCGNDTVGVGGSVLKLHALSAMLNTTAIRLQRRVCVIG